MSHSSQKWQIVWWPPTSLVIVLLASRQLSEVKAHMYTCESGKPSVLCSVLEQQDGKVGQFLGRWVALSHRCCPRCRRVWRWTLALQLGHTPIISFEKHMTELTIKCGFFLEAYSTLSIIFSALTALYWHELYEVSNIISLEVSLAQRGHILQISSHYNESEKFYLFIFLSFNVYIRKRKMLM